MPVTFANSCDAISKPLNATWIAPVFCNTANIANVDCTSGGSDVNADHNTDADVKGLAKYNLATRRVTEAIEGMKVSMGRNLMPTMTRLKTSFADMLPGLTTALAPAFVALGNAAATALDGIGANMPQIEGFAKSFGVEIEQIAKSFQANWPEIKETIRLS